MPEPDTQPLDETAWMQAIVESSHDAIFATDLDGIITTWNPAAERMYGYSRDEAIGRHNEIIIPPDKAAEEADVRRRLVAGEPVLRYQTVRVRKDGRRVGVSLLVSALRGRDGRIVGLSKLSHDILESDRLRLLPPDAAGAGRELAAIVMSTHDAIIGLDLHGRIRAWNRAAERMYGYAADEALGQSIEITLPAERRAEESFFLDRIRRGDRIDSFETVRCRRDGTCFPVALTISPVYDEEGAVTGASKIARDITEQKRAAERAAFLTEAGAVLAGSLEYETTLKAVVNLAVPAIADWCAADILSDDRKLERLAVAHVDPEKIELARAIRARYEDPASPFSSGFVVRTGKPAIVKSITDDMIVASAKGDEERVRLVRSLGLRSYMIVPLTVHGRTFGALTFATAQSGRLYSDGDFRFAQEVAYRAAIAIDNARAYREAQTANRLKDEFLATLSHELRTPLNAIVGYTRLMQSGIIGGDRQSHVLAIVERNASSLTQIVEDILDVSRIISGKVRLNVQAVDVASVIREAIETMTPAAEAKDIRVQTILDPRAGPISGDPDRLRQIVWNLVSNAVKFTPKQGTVQIRLERINSHVEIVVSDTGIGIAPEFLPYIFERFRQADIGPTRAYAGLGLGLAIVRHLVELHGGSIRAATGGPDKGATFTVRLPLMALSPEIAPERRTAVPSSREVPRDVPRLDGLAVLAVDDDADARALVTEALQAVGATVRTADSVARAIDALGDGGVDVLLADIGMVGSDGFELIRRVRESGDPRVRAIPAAALTAYARAEDRTKVLQAGFQMHLAKPVDPAELIVAVASLAKQRLRG